MGWHEWYFCYFQQLAAALSELSVQQSFPAESLPAYFFMCFFTLTCVPKSECGVLWWFQFLGFSHNLASWDQWCVASWQSWGNVNLKEKEEKRRIESYRSSRMWTPILKIKGQPVKETGGGKICLEDSRTRIQSKTEKYRIPSISELTRKIVRQSQRNEDAN